jgi:hypothetical protein
MTLKKRGDDHHDLPHLDPSDTDASVSDYNLSDHLLTCSIFPVTFLSPILNI